jgi:Cu/Ag efflux pump CusA
MSLTCHKIVCLLPMSGALTRYGMNVSDVEEAVEARASGAVISQLIEDQKRYDCCLRTYLS